MIYITTFDNKNMLRERTFKQILSLTYILIWSKLGTELNFSMFNVIKLLYWSALISSKGFPPGSFCKSWLKNHCKKTCEGWYGKMNLMACQFPMPAFLDNVYYTKYLDNPTPIAVLVFLYNFNCY